MSLETEWYVVTGSPSSGKTKTIEGLASRGCHVIPEAARAIIDDKMGKGMKIEEIRADEFIFQNEILQRNVEIESNLPPSERIFLDRGIPDTIAYLRLFGLDPESAIAASRTITYSGVFLMEPLDFSEDYARVADAETALKLHSLIGRAYTDLGYSVVNVPVMAIDDRVKFILDTVAAQNK